MMAAADNANGDVYNDISAKYMEMLRKYEAERAESEGSQRAI